jgi:hypothetical protein
LFQARALAVFGGRERRLATRSDGLPSWLLSAAAASITIRRMQLRTEYQIVDELYKEVSEALKEKLGLFPYFGDYLL